MLDRGARAVATIVWSTAAMNRAMETTAKTRPLCLAVPGWRLVAVCRG